MSDEIRERFEWWWIDGDLRDNPLNKTDIRQGYIAGHKSRDEEIQRLEADCRDLVEINENQAEIVEGLEADKKLMKEQYDITAGNFADGLTGIQEALNGRCARLGAENKELLEAVDLMIKDRDHFSDKADKIEAENKNLINKGDAFQVIIKAVIQTFRDNEKPFTAQKIEDDYVKALKEGE